MIFSIRGAIFQSDDFQEAKHFPVRFGAFANEVIELSSFSHLRDPWPIIAEIIEKGQTVSAS
jgi:hypothetical protein